MLRTAALSIALGILCGVAGARNGVKIEVDENGQFVYEDDFSTPRCLIDAFLDNTGPEVWREGSLFMEGPNRHRMLTWRFFGDRVITDLSVVVQQRASARQWGGRNMLLLSRNGLDWVTVADSREQDGGEDRWQEEPLEVESEVAEQFEGGDEVWVRLHLDNFSGLETIVSNQITNLRVELTLGEPAAEAADPQRDLRLRWGELREDAGWQAVTLDAADPPDSRPPHYYEDADGWLVAPGDEPHLDTAERDAFTIRRVYRSYDRSPLSLNCFVETERDAPLMVRVAVLATREGARQMRVLWDGEEVASFDAGSFFDEERPVFADLPSSGSGLHRLTVTSGDQGAVVVRQIALAGPAGARWAAKPDLPRGRRLEVLSARYVPDPPPPPDSQAVEGRHRQQEAGLIFEGLQRLYNEHAEFGALRIHLRNPGDETVRIARDIRLNGAELADAYVDFETSDWDAPGVVWWRCRPRTVEPGECAELYVRFRHRPEGDAAEVRIPCENAPAVWLEIPYEAPPARIEYACAGADRDRLHVYVSSDEADGLAEIALDGVPADAALHGADFAGGVALAVAELAEPLDLWSYHSVSATLQSGETVSAQFRVLPWLFPRSSIHVPSAMCDEMNMNLGMWHHRSLEECREHDIYTVTTREKMFVDHERVLFVMGPDEPDAHDNRGGGYDRGLGSHARRLMESGWGTLVRTQADAATWVIMNGTIRPLNWCVYGQLADVACFDPYPINFYGADHACVRESLGYARLCGAPHRIYACLETFGWSKGQGVPTNRRGPLPEEYRQNVVQALGAGAKGLTSWVYSAGAGGWQLNEPCREEMARMNALLASIEGDLLLGCPVGWASTDAGLVDTGVVGAELWPKERVWAGALLCGPDTIVVAVANHIPASKPERPTIEPADNVTVSVALPDWMGAVEAYEATPEGAEPLEVTVEDATARVRLDSIAAGRVLVLRAR